MPESLPVNGVQELVDRCLACLEKKQLRDASSALTEAITRAPHDPRVKRAWEAWSLQERNTDLLTLCKSFAENDGSATTKIAVTSAVHGEFTPEVAAQAINILLEQESLDTSNTSELIGVVCSRLNGRKGLANVLSARPTETLERFWTLGPSNVDAITQCLTVSDLWSSSNDQTKAAVTLFPLLLLKLLDSDAKHEDVAMRSVSKLMAVKGTELASLIDSQSLVVLLSFLDIDCSAMRKSQATLAIAKFTEASPTRGQEMLKDYIVSRMGGRSIDDLVAAVSAAGALFPVTNDFAAELFSSPGFPEQLVRIAENTQSTRLRRAVLELFSAACVSKGCRAKMFDVCSPWLKQIVQSSNSHLEVIMAGLVLSKLSQELQNKAKSMESNEEVQSKMVSIFKDAITGTEETEIHIAIEALAYNTVDPNIKEQLASDKKFLRAMIDIMSKPDYDGPTFFGGLTILSNLTTYSPDLAPEQRRMAQLESYANQLGPLDNSPLHDAEYVKERCKKVLDSGVTSVLRVRKASPGSLQLISNILLSLSKERRHCGIMAQQGMFDVVLRLAHMDYEDAGGILAHTRRQSSQALARMIISVNPALLQTRADGAVEKCIGPLDFLLSHLEPSVREHCVVDNSVKTMIVQSNGNEATDFSIEPFHDDPYCAFDALRALTNLAGLRGQTADLVDEKCFPSIAVYLQSSRSALQQAATECVCNLSNSPNFVLSHYALSDEEGAPYGPGFDMDAPSANRKQVHFLRLVWLTNAKARGTRVAALGALATMTSMDVGRRMLIRAPDGLEYIIVALKDAQAVEAGEALGQSGADAEAGDIEIRLRAWCIVQDICCNTHDAEVHRRFIRHGVMKLLSDGAKHMPEDEQLKQSLLGFTEPTSKRLKEVFTK